MTIETTAVACALRAIMAHRVSTVVVNTVGNLSAVNIPAGSFGVILVGSLNAMDIRAGSSAAANIPAVNTVGASMVNVEGMASIATERERQRYTLARSSPAAMQESCLGDFGLLVSASNRTLTRPMPSALAISKLRREVSSVASATRTGRWRTSIMQAHSVIASMAADLIQRTWARFLAIAVKLVTHVSSLRFQLSERAHRAA